MKKTSITIAKIFGSALVVLVLVYIIISSQQENEALTAEAREEAPGEFISLQHGLVHYSLEGPDSSDLIIFIHGGGITGQEVWKENIPYFLKRNYRVLSYDLYGRGYTDRPNKENSPELFLDQLTELREKLRLNDPAHIVCMSMGAIVALDYAYTYPDKVDKIVMIDPAATGDFKPSTLLKIPILSQIAMTVYWYPRARENQRIEFVNQDLFNAYSDRLSFFMNFEGYKQTNYSTWMHMLNQNKLPLLKNIPSSTILLIYGTEDPYFPEKNLTLYRNHYPTLETIKVNDAGHMPHFEKPDTVNEIIYSFLME